jgi:hypothetical protein
MIYRHQSQPLKIAYHEMFFVIAILQPPQWHPRFAGLSTTAITNAELQYCVTQDDKTT